MRSDENTGNKPKWLELPDGTKVLRQVDDKGRCLATGKDCKRGPRWLFPTRIVLIEVKCFDPKRSNYQKELSPGPAPQVVSDGKVVAVFLPGAKPTMSPVDVLPRWMREIEALADLSDLRRYR